MTRGMYLALAGIGILTGHQTQLYWLASPQLQEIIVLAVSIHMTGSDKMGDNSESEEMD